jgi:hypothetical protein
MHGLPWAVIPVKDGSSHIVPDLDNRKHTCTSRCWCRSVENEDGNYVHNSWDGRELFERGERLVS